MKKKYVVCLVILIVLILAIGGFFWLKKANNNTGDAKNFSEEYTAVGSDNVFVYRNIDEIINILEHGTGVVYLGFPECQWCQAYVKYLNEVAKEVGIDKIYYCDIYKDRADNTDAYLKIVSILGDNLLFDNEGKPRIYVPDISYVVNGKIIGHDNESSLVTSEDGTPDEYWTNERVEKLKKRTYDYMDTVYGYLKSCTDCNK